MFGLAFRLPFFHKLNRLTTACGLHHSINNRTLSNCNFLARYCAFDFRCVTDFHASCGYDVALNGARYDYRAGPYCPFPDSIPGKRDRSVDAALAINLTVNQEIAGSRQDAFNFASLADQGAGTASGIAQTPQFRIAHWTIISWWTVGFLVSAS
jgi:hypothetical protein